MADAPSVDENPSDDESPSEVDRSWFEEVWADREERIYPGLFGPLERTLAPLSPELFRNVFGQAEIDPRWLHHGVLASPPNEHRPTALYVTSGMSNAWDDDAPDPEGYSGIGCEFVLETNLPGSWAVERLQQLMAFQLLLCADKFPGKEPLNYYDRLPLRSPITPEPSELTYLMLAEPVGYAEQFPLRSGRVVLLAAIGITEGEAAFARREGGSALVERLAAAGAFPVVDPRRRCILTGERAG